VYIINFEEIAYHQNAVLYIIIAKVFLYTLCVIIYSPDGLTRYNDSNAIVDDMPLLSQWIKKSTSQNLSIFWLGNRDLFRRNAPFAPQASCPRALQPFAEGLQFAIRQTALVRIPIK